MSANNHPCNLLRGGLVVSVQPVENGPLDKTDTIVAMAMAAVIGGAAGLRIEGALNVAAVRRAVDIPLIGIVKREREGSPVRITPTLFDANALIEAGADIIAIDMTSRERHEPLLPIVQRVLDAGILLMGDCSTKADGEQALNLGANIIGTTLSGYTAETAHRGASPDFALISHYREIAGQSGFVMAEGRVNTPELAAAAIKAGADCVTVGSAITRLEHVTQWFASAIKGDRALT